MTDTSTALTTTQETTPATLAALDKYARSAGGFYGDLLKFSGKTGLWTAGSQGTEIALGTQLVAIIPAMLVGYVQWKDGELVGEELVPLAPGYDPRALRATLGDHDESAWPRDEDGKPEDPWREAAKLPLKNLETGAEYTFSTSSVGGVRACKHLVGVYSKQIQAAPQTTAGHLQVVELGARPYQHSNRKRGTIYNPVLKGEDWVHASRVTDKIAPGPKLEPAFKDYRSEKTKFKKARARV